MRKLFVSLSFLLLASVGISAQTAEVSNINVTYDKSNNNLTGMEISFELKVWNCKERPVSVVAYFYDRDDNAKRSYNMGHYSGYCSNNGTTSSRKVLTPRYDSSHWESVSLFLPYDALKHQPGNNKYSFLVCVRGPRDDAETKNNVLGKSSYHDFHVTWPESSKVSQNSQNSQSNQSNYTSQSSQSSTDNTSKKYPYTERSTTSNGETATTYYADGRVDITTTINCTVCNHTGNCLTCGGTGSTFFMNMFYPCPLCGGTGKCAYCHGLGKMTSTYSYNRNAPAVSTAPSTGTTYYDPGTSSTSSYSGSTSTSTSTRRTCPGCRGTKIGMSRIEWAPNYTGKDNTQWCAECGAYKQAHVHIHETCRVCNGKGYVE